MDELFKKITSYNILNYLLPGVLFAFFVTELTPYSLVQEDWIQGVFFYYFLGMVVSHIGSVLLAPIMRVTRLAPQEPYEDYLTAVKKDEVIPILAQERGTIRSFLTAALLIIAIKAYSEEPFLSGTSEIYAVFAILGLIFLLAYRRQTSFISKRVTYSKKLKDKDDVLK